jgi:hypothetical protein
MHTKWHTTVLNLLAILLHHRQYWVEGTTRKIHQAEFTENSLIYCSRVTWCSTRTHTFTSCVLPWNFRKIRLEIIFFPFFNHAVPKFKVRPVLFEFRVDPDWLKCPRHKRKSLCWPADTQSSHDPRTLPSQGTHLQQRFLSWGSKGRICRASRTDVDLTMQMFIK